MHSMPNFCGSWRGIETRVERQATTSSHVFVRHPWETCSFTLFSESVFTLNHQTFTYFVQRRSFLSSCYHFNLKQAFKVNNLVPMTMHHGRCQLVACPLSSQRSRMRMQKRPLFSTTTLKSCFPDPASNSRNPITSPEAQKASDSLLMVLMANRRNDPGIRNFESNLTSTRWAKKRINFYSFQIAVYFILFVIGFQFLSCQFICACVNWSLLSY